MYYGKHSPKEQAIAKGGLVGFAVTRTQNNCGNFCFRRISRSFHTQPGTMPRIFEDFWQFVGWLCNPVENSERCENRRFRMVSKFKRFRFTGSLRFERHRLALLKLHRGRNHSEPDELCHDGARFSLCGLWLWLDK